MMLVPLAAGRCGDCDAVNAGQCVQQAETVCEMLYMPVTRLASRLRRPTALTAGNLPLLPPLQTCQIAFSTPVEPASAACPAHCKQAAAWVGLAG